MSEGTGLDKFSEKFPSRFFDVGIAESHGITLPAALRSKACTRSRPSTRLLHSAPTTRWFRISASRTCRSRSALDRAGLVGEDGPTHHGVFDIAYLRHVPNMVVMAPKDENELQHMIKTAVEHAGPTAVRYPRGTGLGVPMDQEIKTLPIGAGELLRDGSDVAIIAIGNMVHPSLEAAKRLAVDGISAAVVNARFVKPLDEALIIQVAKSAGRIVTVEEHALQGGFGSAVLECLDRAGVTGIKTYRIGLPDAYIEHGTQATLRKKYGLDADGIYSTVREFAEKSRLKAVAPFVSLGSVKAKDA